jgi:hypothetical protein
MAWSLFGRRRQIEQQVENYHGMADGLVMPFSSLVTNMVSASWECTQQTRPHLRPNDALKNQPSSAQETYIHFTYLTYFIRLYGLVAFSAGLDRAAFLRIRDILVGIIARTQVQHFFGEGPDREKIESLCRDALSDAESQDEKSASTYVKTLDNIGFDLARDILVLAGHKVGGGQQIDAEPSELLYLVRAQVNGIRNEKRFTEFEESLRLANRAVEFSEKASMPLARVLRDGIPA